MNYNEKKALVRCQKQITRDLEVKYIIDSLLEHKILQEQDKDEITKVKVENCWVTNELWQKQKTLNLLIAKAVLRPLASMCVFF